MTNDWHELTDLTGGRRFLVTEVRDAKESVLTTVKMQNGVQLYSDKDLELLTKRGVKPEELQNLTRMREGPIPARGTVNFELRVMNPPSGSAGVLPALKAFDQATQGADKP